MANLSAVIGSTNVTVLAISENNTMDGRSVTTLTLYDAAGTQDFPERTQVTVNDTLNNYFFSGFVTSDQKTPMPNGVALTHQVSCVDETDIPVRHYYSGPEWANRYAGDIVTDLVAGPLSADGITASYAIDEDKALSDFQQGTQSNTAAVATATGGALQLALAGTAVTKKESATADFSAGTLTNVQALSNTLTLTSHAAAQFTGTCTGYQGVGGASASVGVFTGPYSIVTGDSLQYTMWIASTSPQIMASVDGICSDGSTIGNFAPSFSHQIRDQNGLWASPAQDLTGYANNQWYSRTIDLSLLNGKTLSLLTLSFAGSNPGQYTAYFYGLVIKNGGTTKLSIPFVNNTGLKLIIGTAVSQQGYTGSTVSAITAYDPTGTRLSPATSLTPVGCLGQSLISYQATLPTSTQAGASSTVAVYTSTDNATWQLVTNLAAIPSLIVGASSSGVSLYFKEVLTILGPDPTIAPILTNVTATIQPTYVNVNTDWIKTVSTQAGWNAGTLTGLTSQSNNDLTLQNAQSRNWDDASIANQTLFTSSGGSQGTVNRNLDLVATNGNDARSRFDFAGAVNQFDVSIAVQVPAAGANIGLEWATTSWANGLNSFAYVAYITTTQIKFSKGTNGTAGAETNIGNATFATALTPGDWHVLRVKWGQTANTTVVYLDGVLYPSVGATDATYPSNAALAYVGVRFYNNTGASPPTQTGYFDNFALVQTLASNLYTSQSLTGLGNVGTVQDSRLFWQSDEPQGTAILAQVSVNGGAYANATNGATIPGLTKGLSVTGQHLNVKFTFNSTDPTLQPVLHGYTAWVTSAYSSSGNRISVPLSLAPVVKAGATGVTWTGVQPANTTVAIDTSTDSINWTQAGSGVSGQAAVAGIFSQSDPVVDQFSSNTSANYTSTFRTGGAIATWVWDIANKRLTVSGGTNAQLIYNSPLTGVDVDESFVMDLSDNGGFVWRWVDQSNHYYLAVHDASSGNNPNTAQLFVVSGGTATQIGANAAISFTRGTPHAFRVSMIGTSILILMDGVVLFNTGDATINQAGFAGFRTDSTGGSSARFYLFRLQYYGQDVSTATIFSRVRFTSTDPTVTPQVNALSMSVHDPAIQNGALIPLTNYSVLNNNRMTIAQICDDLIKQSGFTTSSTNFWWKVINNKMTFQQHQATPAPWVLTPQGATNCDIVDSPAPMIDNVNPTYRNSQWGTGGMDVVAQSRSFVGNGTQTTFDCGFPIDSVTSITLNGATQTFGLSNVSTGLNWYYTQGQSTVVQDTSGTPLIGSQTLTVAFNAQVSITANVQNPAEIARIANIDNTTGVIDEGEDMSGLNKQAMIAKCSGLVNQFGQKNQTLTFTTNRAGLAVGQLLPVFASPLGVFAGAFLLIQVKISWRVVGTGGGAIMQSPRFECQGVSGPQVLGWLRYLSRLGVN